MRYVRTKDGRIVDLERYTEKTNPMTKALGWLSLIDKEKKCDIEIYSKNIIKQADNIEELCDEFVLIDEENEHYIKQDNDIHHIRRKWAIGNYIVYGAIWTDKGLIYKAKMKGILPNGEKDWELL